MTWTKTLQKPRHWIRKKRDYDRWCFILNADFADFTPITWVGDVWSRSIYTSRWLQTTNITGGTTFFMVTAWFPVKVFPYASPWTSGPCQVPRFQIATLFSNNFFSWGCSVVVLVVLFLSLFLAGNHGKIHCFVEAISFLSLSIKPFLVAI